MAWQQSFVVAEKHILAKICWLQHSTVFILKWRQVLGKIQQNLTRTAPVENTLEIVDQWQGHSVCIAPVNIHLWKYTSDSGSMTMTMTMRKRINDKVTRSVLYCTCEETNLRSPVVLYSSQHCKIGFRLGGSSLALSMIYYGIFPNLSLLERDGLKSKNFTTLSV